ncbi:hypothetical protein SS50377_26950 [Spironucleus salmonicida]|uniref:Uncharacterized protein n=1 Tax=Spironucleus salmonicida TaxID=348837 RepID=V6LUT1_9EUKA|nr:hypothetical protein SS50377_26950 [Spironucleus salmonicida]|eukprot:EST47461.1 Hypothetical protein SS50377_12446 [Spironucleus salmonicida]
MDQQLLKSCLETLGADTIPDSPQDQLILLNSLVTLQHSQSNLNKSNLSNSSFGSNLSTSSLHSRLNDSKLQRSQQLQSRRRELELEMYKNQQIVFYDWFVVGGFVLCGVAIVFIVLFLIDQNQYDSWYV